MSNLLDRRISLSGMGSGIALSTVGLTLGGAFNNPALASNISPYKTLVLLELKGGNDGLNTVIPFMDKEKARVIVRNALRLVDFQGIERMVRINSSDIGLKDLEYIENL